ncbi:MAG: OmpA family protein, partial [Saprospiraceae bacterium]|nr:OmpA family protein [Saprospiraceae bacterium]
YGCKSGIMQCREYIEVKLEERLVPCATYYLEFWLNPVANSIRVNNFGAAVLDKPYLDPYAELLEGVDLVLNEDSIVGGAPNQWHKVSGTFVAESPALFLIIGNFFSDDETLAQKTASSIPYSFYLLDDVLLRRVPGAYDMACLLEQPSGTVFSLEEVYFDHNRHIIKPNSFPSLEELATVLLDNPGLTIELHGHTDDTGNSDSNQELSSQRAEAVQAFLINKGVDPSRLSTKGFGATKAVADNTDEAGRQLNRRVEVKIIQQD